MSLLELSRFREINAIIERDSKDTICTFTLLWAVIDLSQGYAHLKQNWVEVPLGQQIEKHQLFSTIEIGLNLLISQKRPREGNRLRDNVARLLGGDNGIICLNKKEGVLLINSVGEFITGTTTRSLFLSSVRDILRFPDEIASSLFVDSLVQASRGTPSVGKMKNFLVRSKDGSTKSASLNILPVRKTDGGIIGIVIQVIFTHSATMRNLMQQHVAI